MSKRQNPKSKNTNLSQFGLLDFTGSFDNDEMMEGSDDDLDLEAELAAISGGGSGKKKPRTRPAPGSNLDAMIAESLKDIPSDEDISGDEDDSDLLSELRELTVEDNEAAPELPARVSRPAPAPPSAENSMVNLLQERISNYTLAEQNAKEKGESSRARRFARGLKTLNDLLKQAKAGKDINEEDIPPVVSVGKPTPADVPAPPAPTTGNALEEPTPEPVAPVTPASPTPNDSALDTKREQGLQFLLKRKGEFTMAALAAKQAGDKYLALELFKVVKDFDVVVTEWKSGKDIDLNLVPTVQTMTDEFKHRPTDEQLQQSSSEAGPSPVQDKAVLITASSLDEALKQHLAAYQEQESKAKEQGNSSKQRRMGRIVKQYEQAIKLNAAGRPILVDELPTPFGYAPLPITSTAKAPSPPPKPNPRHPSAPEPPPKPRAQTSRADKQLAFLLLRQRQFKEAALNSKKNGDMAQAKEYLRSSKGFDAVIEAARGGLIVDLKSLPLPPQAKQQLEETFDVVSAEDCGPSTDEASGDVLSHLHQQLTTQLKLCLTNRDHYKAMGNVAETNRFEHLAVTVKQDLDVVTIAKRLGKAAPKFHYESRQFSVVQCNTDLNENDLELTIVRGIAYSVPNPKEIDTYVKFEFPYPQDAPVSDRTGLVKDTNSPVYNAPFTLAIHRSGRPCLRVFKRHGIKFEVYSRGGWFSRDALLGSLTVKLAPLETNITLHEAFPLMDGRRPAGGSLEVKLRVRTPLLQQQFVNTTHRWLVIDN